MVSKSCRARRHYDLPYLACLHKLKLTGRQGDISLVFQKSAKKRNVEAQKQLSNITSANRPSAKRAMSST